MDTLEFTKQQADSLAALIALSGKAADADHHSAGDRASGDRGIRPVQPVPVPARQTLPGALAPSYDIPRVRFSRRWALTAIITTLLIVGAAAWRFRGGVHHLPVYLFAIAPMLFLHAFSWVLSCFDRPYRTTATDDLLLRQQAVTVSVPVKDEDPGILDRTVWSIVNQSRPPDRLDIVNDASDETDYTVLKRFWPGQHGATRVTWTDKSVNEGKRRAHCTTFARDQAAEIFITVDSDTCLAWNAIEEILKPFADHTVMSVAGIELGMNAGKNLLTVIQNGFQQSSQAIIGAAWSVTGNMFTNRGPFAAYRASMLREILPLYWGETIFGRRVILGDDSLLALAGSMRGKSVQQLSAFGLTMWPDNLGWHLRQRTRWARGRTIRNFWRFKYYRLDSYIYWFTFTNTYTFLVVTLTMAKALTHWRFALPLVAHIVLALLLFSWVAQLRCLCFRRSDETFSDRALVIVMRPAASVWASLVLNRFVRFYGTITFLRMRWTTRNHGAEVTILAGE